MEPFMNSGNTVHVIGCTNLAKGVCYLGSTGSHTNYTCVRDSLCFPPPQQVFVYLIIDTQVEPKQTVDYIIKHTYLAREIP